MNDTPESSVKRTVQLAGNSTFVISLPKAWATEQELEPGASMHLYPHRDRVVLAPAPLETSERTRRVDAGSVEPEVVCHRIKTAYATGSDRIIVVDSNGLDRDVRRRLTRLIARLIGVEILQETEDRIVAADFLDVGDVSLPQTTAQIRQHALTMSTDAIDALRTDDEALARRVIDRGNDVDRLFAFVSRAFHRGLENVQEINTLGVDRWVAFHSYRTARELERIADHAERIATVTVRQSTPPTEPFGSEIEELAADAREVVELGLEGAVDATLSTCSAVLERTDRLDQQRCDRRDPDAYRYGSVLVSIRRIAELGVSLSESAVETEDTDD